MQLRLKARFAQPLFAFPSCHALPIAHAYCSFFRLKPVKHSFNAIRVIYSRSSSLSNQTHKSPHTAPHTLHERTLCRWTMHSHTPHAPQRGLHGHCSKPSDCHRREQVLHRSHSVRGSRPALHRSLNDMQVRAICAPRRKSRPLFNTLIAILMASCPGTMGSYGVMSRLVSQKEHCGERSER